MPDPIFFTNGNYRHRLWTDKLLFHPNILEIMKKTIVYTAILAISTFTALGQVTPSSQSTTPHNSRIQISEDRIRTYTDRMTNDLQLNANQAKQLHEFHTKSYNNHQILIQNQVTGAERSQIEQSNEELYEGQIRGVLTEEQYNQYKSRRTEYQIDWNAGETDLPTQDLRDQRAPVARPGNLPADPATQPGTLPSTRPSTQPQNPNVPQSPVPPSVPQ